MMRLANSDGSSVVANYMRQQNGPERIKPFLMKRIGEEEGRRFIGTIEGFEEGWRASFRLRVPNEVFAQRGKTEIFATEIQATKWLHKQATERGFSSIEMERQG
jgi:hypothetical protein